MSAATELPAWQLRQLALCVVVDCGRAGAGRTMRGPLCGGHLPAQPTRGYCAPGRCYCPATSCRRPA